MRDCEGDERIAKKLEDMDPPPLSEQRSVMNECKSEDTRNMIDTTQRNMQLDRTDDEEHASRLVGGVVGRSEQR